MIEVCSGIVRQDNERLGDQVRRVREAPRLQRDDAQQVQRVEIAGINGEDGAVDAGGVVQLAGIVQGHRLVQLKTRVATLAEGGEGGGGHFAEIRLHGACLNRMTQSVAREARD